MLHPYKVTECPSLRLGHSVKLYQRGIIRRTRFGRFAYSCTPASSPHCGMSSLKEPRENSQSTLGSGALADLRGITIPFQVPILTRSLAQLANSFGGFWGICAVMYLCVGRSLWITL